MFIELEKFSDIFVDTHAHVFDSRLANEKLDLSTLSAVLVPAYTMQNLSTAFDACRDNEKLFCALGVHPQYAQGYDQQSFDAFVRNNINGIYAIGEIGLDSNCETPYERQIEVFLSQLDIAREFDLPVSVHLRTSDDYTNFFDVVAEYSSVPKILHCFNGNEDNLSRALDSGCYISYATNITYRGNVRLRELARKTPLDRLLMETDSPNLLPATFARRGLNVPQNIIFVAQTLQSILGMDIMDIAHHTSKNAHSILNLKSKVK